MITASIVTYKNDPAILSRTISSYLKASGNSKLFVLDNSPTDGARSLCQHPSIEYINNGSNIGFGKAHNIALKRTLHETTYHLVLNPDVYFEPHVLEELLDFMNGNPKVGLVMPKVLYPDGRLQPLCRLLPVPQHLFLRRFFPILKKTNVINEEYQMLFTGYNEITEVPFLSGCFMLMRCEALQTVGLFDERFFLYFEDTDLSRRIHERFKTMYYPHVSIHHVHERSSHKELKPFLYSLNSARKYFSKWGWVVDTQRDKINREILVKYQVNGYQLQSR